jgi:hypothetical protein
MLRRCEGANCSRHGDYSLANGASAVDESCCGRFDGGIHASQKFLLAGHPAKGGRAQGVDRRHAVCRNFATDQELSRASAGNCQGFHATVQCSFAQLDPIRRGLNPTVCHLLRCISTGSSMATISPGGKLGVRFAGGDVNHSAGNGKDARPSAVKIARVKPAWAGLNER